MKNNNPLVSIGVPIYGVEKYIERCAKSLFEQSYQNIEYVFVNDCTKDKSIEVLNNVIEKYPLRKNQITIINHESNKGLSGARITAINSCNGEYITWVDSDDFIDTKMIEKLVNKAVETNADIISCNAIIHYPDKTCNYISPCCNSSQELVLAIINRQSLRSVWARLIRKSLYLEHNIYPTLGVNNGEDFQVMPRLAYYGKPAYIEDCLYHYNCENVSSYTYNYTRNKADCVWETLKMLETFFYDKEEIYLNAVIEEEAKTIIRDMVNSCREGYKDYYIKSKGRIKSIDNKVISRLPLSYKIVLWAKSYHIIRCCVMVVDTFSRGTK